MAKIDEIKMLRLGQRDENLARTLTFDCSDWLEQYPEASIHILFRRPGESAIVPMSTTLEGATLTWLIHDYEVGKTGVGNAEFRAVDTAGLRRKSRIIPCSIEDTLLGDDETVLYTQDQVDETLAHISEAAQSAQAAKASEEAAALSASEAGESAASAGTAVDVAVGAKNAAQAAQTAAETAQHQAEAAQSGVHADAEAAEQAKVAAQAAQASAQGAASQASADRTAAESARADAEAAATHAEAVVEGIDQAGADQVAAVNAAGQAQVIAVNQAGITQVGNVNAAGTTQVNAVQAKGTQVLDSIPADYSALTSEVTGLKSALDESVADIKEDLSQIWSDQIVGMTPTDRQKESVNLFKYAELVGPGKIIYSISNGKVVLTDSTTGYNTYLIPVDGESTYTFTNCRTAVLVSDREYTAIGQLQTYTTSIDSTGGKYIIFSFNPTTYPVNTYSITKPVSEYIIPNNWNLGDFEVETQQINGMLPTGKTIESSNLFSKASLVASGKYVDRITNGKAVLGNSTNLDTYIIPVDGESTYTFTNCRTAVVVSDLEYTAVGSLLTYATEINSTGGTYILFSFNRTTYPPASYKVTKPVAEYTIPNNWNLYKGTKTGYQRKTGSIASGGSLALTGKTAIKYGYQIIFKAFISAFNELKLAFYNYNNSAVLNAINVTTSDLVIYVGNNVVETLPHGLTIANDISLVLDYRVDGIKVTLYSNGESFETTTTFVSLTSGVVSPSIISTGTVCTSAVFEMTVPRAKKPVWYFGDSYISYTNTARWTYYLVHDGFDGNTLLNGYAGGTSATTVMALTALLLYGTPEYAVFATGMNDNSDSTSAPSTSWVNARDNFISLCESNGIEMIFATVPTVPSVNNEQKNAWVKSSGYRYIDFAKAVGADGAGAWYSGMLSADNVHPTEKGAKALYTQAITDFPEFLT